MVKFNLIPRLIMKKRILSISIITAIIVYLMNSPVMPEITLKEIPYIRSDEELKTADLQEKIEKNLDQKSSVWKTIVIWPKFYGRVAPWKKIFNRHYLKECEEQRCYITTTRSRIDVADAVVFDGTKLMSFDDDKNSKFEFWPPERKRNQIYIFFMQDPPSHLKNVNFKLYKNFFNWTMTYRLDSDVVAPYGKVYKRETRRTTSEIKYLTDDELSQKKTAIWLESHCDVQSKRRQFVDQLQKFIPIEIFGRCVNRKCGSNSLIFSGGVGRDPCERSFVNYTFFMALENSFCKDYVTEKFYRSLKLGIIPVAFGAVNYSVFAPPNSFISAADFHSVSELADYMRTISTDASLYNRFLKWKEDYDVDVGFPYNAHICDLCKKLHSNYDKSTPKWYPCIKEWFIDKANCYESKFT